MSSRKITELIKKHEGLRLTPYRCSADKLTIGYGRNLDDVGISEEEAVFLLEHDIAQATREAISIFPDFGLYSESRQNAIVDMLFNLGKSRFLGFRKMIASIKKGDWIEAKAQAKDSAWHRQVGNRAKEIEEMLGAGEEK